MLAGLCSCTGPFCNKRKITKTNTYHHVFSKVQTPATPSAPPAEESPSESEASEGRVEASLPLSDGNVDDPAPISDNEALPELTQRPHYCTVCKPTFLVICN